jgi:VWFA-related protein
MLGRRHQIIAAITIGLGFATVGGGQNPGFTLAVDVEAVTLDVSVTDANGRVVRDLTRGDFDLFDDGVPRSIRYFGPGTAPYHTFVLVDGSGSTSHKLDFMRRAVAAYTDTVLDADRVRVGVFGSDLQLFSSWSVPPDLAYRYFESGFDPDDLSGTTELYWALDKVMDDGFKDGGSDIRERRAIVVLTDGRDISLYQELVQRNRLMSIADDDSFQKLYRDAVRSGIAIYFVALNTDLNFDANDPGSDEYERLSWFFGDSPMPERYLEQVRLRMEALAEATGGRVYYPLTIGDIVEPFEEIARSLGGAYSLGFEPSRTGAVETETRSIEVRVHREGLIVRQSRDSYPATR